MHKVEMFVPFRFTEMPINIKDVEMVLGSEAHYASKGRYAIIHILKSQGIFDGKVGLSAYMCPTVREELLKRGYEIVFYDIDLEDLNPSIDSITTIIENESPKAIVVASMYGNPANLSRIERLCKESGIIMIDDAAQSIGAKLDGRFVGSFGDGGFFSFSPGKPTSAHRGGYFWTTKKYEIARTRHSFYASVLYRQFLYNRYLAYENHCIKKTIWNTLGRLTEFSRIDPISDEPEPFEYKVMGGVFTENNSEVYEYRKKYYSQISSIPLPKGCRLVRPIRGESNNCKVVYCFDSGKDTKSFEKYLDEKKIRYFTGYTLPEETKNCVNANKIVGHIVELPIDPYEDRLDYMISSVKMYFDKIGTF